MSSESYTPEPSWPYRIDQFEQTAPKGRVLWTAVTFGLLICGLFALLVFGGITTEDWQAYAVGGPLLALLGFGVWRLNHFVRNGLLVLLLILPSLALLLLFTGASEALVLNQRGYRTDAIVTEVDKHARNFPTCRLEEPDGDPVLGSVRCGDLKVGDQVTVTADPLGQISPKQGALRWSVVVGGFVVCALLVMLSTVLGAVLGIRRRGSVRRWWPPASPPRNYGQPSSPFPPPPPPPPGGLSGGPRG